MFEAEVTSVDRSSEVIVTFYVVGKKEVSLLAKTSPLDLNFSKFGVPVNVLNIEKRAFPKIPDIKVRLSIDANVKPVQQPVRRTSVAYEEKVEEKLQQELG